MLLRLKLKIIQKKAPQGEKGAFNYYFLATAEVIPTDTIRICSVVRFYVSTVTFEVTIN